MRLGLVFLLVCLSVFLLEFVECQDVTAAKSKKRNADKKGRPTNKKHKSKPKVKKVTVKKPARFGIMTQLLERGRFQKPFDSLVIPAGGTLALRCRGDRISWTYPSYLDEENDGRFSISHQERFSQLTVVNSTGADTGEYSCWALDCDSETCRKDDSKTGSTYVFFSDPSAPPSATIKASSRSVLAGANFNLTCTVVGETNIEVDFTWEFPGQQMSSHFWSLPTDGFPTFSRSGTEDGASGVQPCGRTTPGQCCQLKHCGRWNIRISLWQMHGQSSLYSSGCTLSLEGGDSLLPVLDLENLGIKSDATDCNIVTATVSLLFCCENG
ncbi:platelet-derived growth factor receptor-like protein isoform X3 [Hemitrygon akajei]|uniref:platelet-derived growth factor receptor-like protein isoform X3 n=1 Tax=Hemitrygon akajei TaxID=2704970 RepID=UPI003BF9CD88